MVASTGNAPKNLSTQSVCHIVTDEVYINLVQISAKEAMDVKSNVVCERMIHNRKYPKDTFPNTWGHISKYMGTHCQIHGDTFPNTWGHISRYMGTHFQIHGDTYPNTWGYIA